MRDGHFDVNFASYYDATDIRPSPSPCHSQRPVVAADNSADSLSIDADAN